MKFGPVSIDDAVGTMLGYAVELPDGKLRKGLRLALDDIAALRAAGIEKVTVAVLDADDVPEDMAADELAKAICASTRGDMKRSEPFNGRVNLLAAHSGVFQVDATMIDRLNAIDPGITLASLANYARVNAGTMLATIKIIPYAVPRAVLDTALAELSAAAMVVRAPQIRTAELILTRTPGFAEKLLKKGAQSVRQRLNALGVDLTGVRIVAHEQDAIASELRNSNAPLCLILGASATSDVGDACPAGLRAAGGTLTRFGMPVDPGNLLFLGQIGLTKVIGLPGCARSPALNGADWVLERLVCGIDVSDRDIAAMGVGGLLKEIPARPQPRSMPKRKTRAPQVEVLLLAAGSSRRMRGADKLLEQIDGVPQLRRAALAAKASSATKVHVVIPADSEGRQKALADIPINLVVASNASEGMAASLRAGLQAASGADAVIVALADMPDISFAHLDALIAAYDPENGHEICRSVTHSGKPGHPVLFGRRFFESLAELEGDQGARTILATSDEFVINVAQSDEAPLLDLDTPEQWAAYRNHRNSA